MYINNGDDAPQEYIIYVTIRWEDNIKMDLKE